MRAQESVLAALLQSELEATTKLDLGLRLAGQLDTTTNEVPDIGPAFDRAAASVDEVPRLRALEEQVDEELDRAATTAFRRSFLLAAALSLCALVPLLWPRRRST